MSNEKQICAICGAEISGFTQGYKLDSIGYDKESVACPKCFRVAATEYLKSFDFIGKRGQHKTFTEEEIQNRLEDMEEKARI